MHQKDAKMTTNSLLFHQNRTIPVVIAGPCVAESYALMDEVCDQLKQLSVKYNFDLVFKASFDKANRSTVNSYRGPGWEVAAKWFQDIHSKYGVKTLTDIHECYQAKEVAACCDVLQIPAFLSRQTDLIVHAVKTGKSVNIKKGQFMAPENAHHIAEKVRSICKQENLPEDFAITERGVTFGYGNLIVDMRSFPTLSSCGGATIFDVTHSLQLPAAQGHTESGGLRRFAPVLARAAAATGYLDGFFLEVHPNPTAARSDASTQLPLHLIDDFFSQIMPIWHLCRKSPLADQQYM
jgi:2-dehydro-3-deoxyphosphooctonate aldolase (KDO 8-P synthase)